MRILSQDGTIDVPYETSILHIVTSTKAEYSKSFIFYTPNNSMDSNELARYSTESKAQKAMEMLHNTYYEHEAEKIYRKGNNYIHPTFQFPKDEDLEV